MSAGATTGIVEQRIDIGRLTLNVATLGVGDPVILLHGFPEYWYSWRHQMRALADAGYRAIAPDLRGFNLSDKPRGVRSYTMDEVSLDIVALLDRLGIERAHIVSHDWGGTVGWYLAARHAARVRSLVSMNSPHPVLFLKLVRSNLNQLRRAWYMIFFQLPFVSELAVQQSRTIRNAFAKHAVHKERFTDEDLERFARAMQQPGAATGALSYYRAGLRYPDPPTGRISVPTRVIWGLQDHALSPKCLDGLEKYVTDFDIIRIADAGHWVQQDTPDEVNRATLEFLARHA